MTHVLSLLRAFESLTQKGHSALLARMSKPTGPARPVVKMAEKVAPADDRDFRFPQVDLATPEIPADLTPGGMAASGPSGRPGR